MGSKYTEAQKRAIQKYQKQFIRTALPLTEEQHERFYSLAKQENTSLKKLIERLLEEEYRRMNNPDDEYIVVRAEKPEFISLSGEQIEALSYARNLYNEFLSYVDFMWEWNWKSEGILNSFDTVEEYGAINRKLTGAGLGAIRGIEIDPDEVPENSNNYSDDERAQKHDEYLDIILEKKNAFIAYFEKIDELCGTSFAPEE